MSDSTPCWNGKVILSPEAIRENGLRDTSQTILFTTLSCDPAPGCTFTRSRTIDASTDSLTSTDTDSMRQTYDSRLESKLERRIGTDFLDEFELNIQGGILT